VRVSGGYHRLPSFFYFADDPLRCCPAAPSISSPSELLCRFTGILSGKLIYTIKINELTCTGCRTYHGKRGPLFEPFEKLCASSEARFGSQPVRRIWKGYKNNRGPAETAAHSTCVFPDTGCARPGQVPR